MSRRKKQPGFNPRENARANVRSIMAGINSAEQVFLSNSEKHAEKIDAEFKRIDTLMSDELKTYMKQWLGHAQAAFLGAMQDFKTNLNKVRFEADQKAVKLMEVIDNHKWVEIRDIVPVAEIELSDYSLRVDNIAQETLLAIIEAGAAYEQRRQCVQAGLRNNWEVKAILEKLTEIDNAAAKAVEVEDEVAQEEPANV